MHWKAGASLIETKVRVYSDSGGLIVFEQLFPAGLVVNGTAADMNGVASAFPAFRPTSLTSTSNATADAHQQRLWMAYNGWDCTNEYGCVSAQAQRVSMGSSYLIFVLTTLLSRMHAQVVLTAVLLPRLTFVLFEFGHPN
jgi:hypothetical protein